LFPNANGNLNVSFEQHKEFFSREKFLPVNHMSKLTPEQYSEMELDMISDVKDKIKFKEI